MHNYYRYSYFYNGNSNNVFHFFVKTPNIKKKKQSQNEHLSQFLDKSDKKVVHEKTHLLKLKFYNADRKMKIIIWGIFISVIMYQNFMHFHQKTSFKRALEFFYSSQWGLRTVLMFERLSATFGQFLLTVTKKFFATFGHFWTLCHCT